MILFLPIAFFGATEKELLELPLKISDYLEKELLKRIKQEKNNDRKEAYLDFLLWLKNEN